MFVPTAARERQKFQINMTQNLLTQKKESEHNNNEYKFVEKL